MQTPMQQILAQVGEFKWYRARPKVSGYMYDLNGGPLVVHVNGIEVQLHLWHHGGDAETTDSLREHLALKFVNGCDPHWHTVLRADGLWWHPTGWFNDYALRGQVFRNKDWCSDPIDDLASLGFVNLIPTIP